MEKSDVNWQLIVMTWLKSRPEKEQDILEKLTDRYVKRTLEYLDMCTRPAIMCNQNQQAKRPHMKRIVDISEINMVTTFCNILEVRNSPSAMLSLSNRYVDSVTKCGL